VDLHTTASHIPIKGWEGGAGSSTNHNDGRPLEVAGVLGWTDAGRGFGRAGTSDAEDDERTVMEPDLLHGGFTKLEIEHSAS